jgi:uncharacterized protein DUF3142
MNRFRWRRRAALAVVLFTPVGFALGTRAPSRAVPGPHVFLWAWERPEDLSFIDPAEVGVAFLAKTIAIDRAAADVRSRRQPLAVPPRTRLIAVVRLETKARPSADGRARALAELLDTARRPGLVGIQIDFDARRSERAWYRALLGQLRASMPSERTLSMTALASWCLSDDWLAGIPVDEIVPMAFRMGPDSARVRRALVEAGGFRAERCRSSVGLATDEPAPPIDRPRRVYLFHPAGGWSPVVLRDALAHSVG